MRKIAIKAVALILATFACLAAYGCAEADAGEALKAYKEGYEKAYELAKIIYGEGLPYEGEYDLTEIQGDKYVKVAESSPYTTKKALKEAILEVYTNDFYDRTLELVLFGGAESDEYGLMGASPRYKEKGGVLYINIKYESPITLDRRENDKAKVTDTKRSSAEITVPSVNSSNKKTTTMVLTDKGWRFDEIV